MRVRGWLLGMGLVAVAGCATQPSGVQSVSAPSAEARAPESDPAATVQLKRSVDIHALKAGQAVQIDNPYGDVRIRFGGYEHQLEWRTVGQQGSGSGVIAINGIDGDAFVVQARLPAGSVLAHDQRVDITVYLPEGHDVDVLTERGLIEARGVKGKLKARSTSGNIAFRGIGGSTTRALNSATATFMATRMPKSRSMGSDEVAMTATPATAVMADTMKARPVRPAAVSTASRGEAPRSRSSTNRNRISEVNSVQAAMTSGPPIAVMGLSFRSKTQATSDAVPTAMSTGTRERRDRTTLRIRMVRNRKTNSSAR